MTSRWKSFPPMTTPRYGCEGVTLRGKLYTMGGYGDGLDGSVKDTMELYHSNKGRWEQAPSRMSTSRYGFAAAAIGNSLYVAGGIDDDGLGNTLDSAEVFDIDSGLWRTLPSMRTTRDGCAGVAVGDEFIVLGGRDDSNTYLNTVESYNDRMGRWEDLPPMINRRSWCAAAVMNDKVYVVGGCDRSHANSVLNTVEVFDLSTRTWTLLPHRMPTKRDGCAAAAVGNYLVVAGGNDGTSRLKIVEMYDVDADRWTDLPSMTTERDGCAAVSLGGSVFVMGGEDKNRSDLDSVEEFQFSDDIVKGMLVDWNEGWSWTKEVVPLLCNRTSVVHKLDIDIALMPTLLSRVGQEGRVQTIFEIVRGEMGVFARPNMLEA